MDDLLLLERDVFVVHISTMMITFRDGGIRISLEKKR